MKADATQRVRTALEAAGLACRIVELDQSAHTAAAAAAALGCDPEQIVKTLVFRTDTTRRAVIVLVSGVHRVDIAALAELLGEGCFPAEPDFVRAQTGFAIGGVAPVGHPAPLSSFADEALLERTRVWVAAGTPHRVVELEPEALLRVCKAKIARLAT